MQAYYLPETEYTYWAVSHPVSLRSIEHNVVASLHIAGVCSNCASVRGQEYSKNQIIGLINLVAVTNSWKRKTRLEILERLGDT